MDIFEYSIFKNKLISLLFKVFKVSNLSVAEIQESD